MVKLWCIFWKGILTACSGFPEPSNGSPCMKWFRLCQRIAHLCTRGSQVTHYVQSKSRVVPHWNQEWPGVFCSAPQTAPEDWSGTLEMQEEVAVTSLRNPHWHLPPLKWFPKANEREETKFQLLYRASLLSLCLLCDHLTVPNTHQQLVFTLNQGTTENWSTGQLQPVHFPSFYHLSSNLEWYTLLSVLSIGQQAAAEDLAVWLCLHCHGAAAAAVFPRQTHKCHVKPPPCAVCNELTRETHSSSFRPRPGHTSGMSPLSIGSGSRSSLMWRRERNRLWAASWFICLILLSDSDPTSLQGGTQHGKEKRTRK